MIVDCCVVLLTIIFPPIGIYVLCGCGPELLWNIFFTLLGYIPGHIHAFFVLLTYNKQPVRYQPIVYVQGQPATPVMQQHYQQPSSTHQPAPYQPSAASPQPHFQQRPSAMTQTYPPPPPYKN